MSLICNLVLFWISLELTKTITQKETGLHLVHVFLFMLRKHHLFEVNKTNTRNECELRPKLTIKKHKGRCWCRSVVFIVNFGHISQLFLIFLLLTLKRYLFAGGANWNSIFLYILVVLILAMLYLFLVK